MNLILLAPDEVASGRFTLTDARADHLRTVLHAEPGDRFQAGVTDGPIGILTVVGVGEDGVTVDFSPEGEAQPPWYDLVLALTRPRQLRRILFQSATLGVRDLFLVGAAKVEKSYFNMHLLREEEYRPVLLEGLMQGKTTAVPRVRLFPKLRDLWDELPTAGSRLIANPAPEGAPAPALDRAAPPIIAIGPDGGWSEAENAAFADHGFASISLGPRPLRTDTAAVALPAVIADRLRRA